MKDCLLKLDADTKFIMEYGSTPYVGMAWEKIWLPHILCTNSYVQNSALDVVRSLYEPNQSFLSVFISNKIVSVARDHRWSTTSVSC